MFDAFAVGESRSVASAEDHRRDRKIKFVDDARAEESFAECAPPFAKEPLDVPFFAQPAKGFDEIDFVAAADFNLIGERLKLAQIAIGNAFADQNDDWGEPMFEDLGVRIERA